MRLSRRRFVQGAAATLLAAPLLRNPEPEVEPSRHWETVPEPRTRWDLPPEHPNCRCAWDAADANPLEDIRAAARQTREDTGMVPDTLVLSPSHAKQIQKAWGSSWTLDGTIAIPGSTITGAKLRIFEA